MQLNAMTVRLPYRRYAAVSAAIPRCALRQNRMLAKGAQR